MDGSRLEIVVGIFVLVGLFILTSIIFGISGAYFLRPGYTIYVMYNTVSDLNPGSSVRLSGVGIGEVKSVKIIYDKESKKPMARVALFLLSDAKLRENYRFRIQGIYSMTEAFIQIEPGETEDAPLLKNGSVVMGEDPVPVEDLVEEAKQIARKFGESAEYLKHILAKVDKGEGTVGKLVSDQTLYDEAVEFIRDLKARPWRLMKRDKKTEVDEEKLERAKSLR